MSLVLRTALIRLALGVAVGRQVGLSALFGSPLAVLVLVEFSRHVKGPAVVVRVRAIVMNDHRIIVRRLIVLVVGIADIEIAVVVSSHQLRGLFKSNVNSQEQLTSLKSAYALMVEKYSLKILWIRLLSRSTASSW